MVIHIPTSFPKFKWLLLAAGAALAFQGGVAMWSQTQGDQYDLLIRGGHIIDGAGNPWFEGSVAVKDGKIAAVGRLPHARARQVIDASGMVVAPGFIDLHNHSDYTLLVDGNAQSAIRQGITTVIIGEDASAGPVTDANSVNINKSPRPADFKVDWKTLGEYFARLQQSGTAVNVASYVGSGQAWMNVLGNVDRRPTPDEMAGMQKIVDEAMNEGAIGIASGLIYAPNMFAQTDELIALASRSARYGGIYTSHIRGESDTGPQATREAVQIGEGAHLPVHILHIKVGGKPNWGRMGAIVEIVQAARARGVDVTADQYPYTASWTVLRECLPPKYLEGTTEQFVQRLKDPKAREEIRTAIANGAPGWTDNEVVNVGGWHGVMISAVLKAENKKFEGKRMDEVAQMTGKDPVDALCDLLISEEGKAYAVYFGMSDADVELAMKQPWVGVGSDGAAISPEMKFMGKPHPRFYGTFPRVLGVYVREKKVLTLPEAIRKMTSLSAQITGLTDRGLLRPGMGADIVIFDPDTVADKATFENPSQYPVGINYVIVNGAVVIDQGQHTGARPGRVLYGPGKQN
jgi:dihydroorotase/N-acyl-D-amino-acid deacylase